MMERSSLLALKRAVLPVALLLATAAAAQSPSKPAHKAKAHPVETAVAQPAEPQPASTQAHDQGEVIARMGDIEVHSDEIRALIAGLGSRGQAASGGDLGSVAQAVRGLLADRYLLKEALAKHWDQQPEVIAAMQRLRDNIVVQTYLQSLIPVPEDYPTEADVQQAYDANKSALMAPRQYRIAQIFVAVPAGADKGTEEKAHAKILEVARALKQPNADFAAIARADSDAKATAEHGGEIGWVSETQLRPDLQAQIAGLAKGAASEPIQVDGGWQIIKLIDTKPAAPVPFAQVHDALKQRLREARAEELRRAYIDGLLKDNQVTINEIALSKLIGNSSQAAR
ncbi:MAG TPA: peptidylprolyl isomerase [Methylovirgula sp.]|nr:peptidylprolyl isomerase [Methylovirgula sp.]